MQQYIPQLTAALAAAAIIVKAYAVPVGAYLAYQTFASLVSLAFARRTQVDTWVTAHPKAALVLRVIRGTSGVDPWLLAKACREYADSRPPTGVPYWFVRVIRRVRVSLGLATLLLFVACQPARAPSTTEAVIAAINLTDGALSTAMIAANPGATELTPWELRVRAVERAAALVRAKGDVCAALPGLVVVATYVSCPACTAAILAASKELACP
jgi:hypothetical protein